MSFTVEPVLPDGRGNSLTDTKDPMSPGLERTLNCGRIAIDPESGLPYPETDRSIVLDPQIYDRLHDQLQERQQELTDSQSLSPPANSAATREALETIDRLCRPSAVISVGPTEDLTHGLKFMSARNEDGLAPLHS